MKYFLDQEFHERMYKPLFGKVHHIIELISIGIVSEDGREYYAVGNEFDLKAAWNNDWLRENVLKPIHIELCQKESIYSKTYHWQLYSSFTLKSMRILIKWRGKSNKQIASEIESFCLDNVMKKNDDHSHTITVQGNPEFYGYYADYDWVLFCSLWGTMMKLPNRFPMYCKDLKQMLDDSFSINESSVDYIKEAKKINGKYPAITELSYILHDDKIKDHPNYPKQQNEHNALADAVWNKSLYNFLQKL